MPLFTVGEVYTAALANALAMSPTAKSAIYTAVDGDFVIVTTGKVITLPAATAQSRVLIYADDANTANGFTAAGGVVKGLGLGSGVAAGTTVPLGGLGSYAVVEADGTNWRIIAGAADTGWIAPSLTNSWANVAAFNTAGYRKQGNRVYLRGGILGGTSGTTAFTLPAGFIPTAAIDFLATVSWTINPGIENVGITTGGAVIPSLVTSGTGSATALVLDSISFAID